MEPLIDFLRQHRADRTGEYTHTCIFKPIAGSFYVPAERADQFMQLYAAALTTGGEMCVTERRKLVAPMVIDIDLRFSSDSGLERRYTQQHVKQIAEAYARAAFNMLDLPSVTLYLMEKPGPAMGKDYVKDGMHFVSPDIVGRAAVHYAIREKVLEDVAVVLNDIGSTNEVEDAVDEAVIDRNSWMLYGSSKPGNPPYDITGVLQFNKDSDGSITCIDLQLPSGRLTDSERNSETLEGIVQLLSLRTCGVSDEVSILPGCEERVVEIEKQAVEREERKRQAQVQATQAASQSNTKRATVDDGELDQIRRLVRLLSDKRVGTYEEWMRVGWCLHNIDNRLLDEWITISQRDPKFKSGECESKWAQMRLNGGLGVGTLHMWAKQDSPDAYKEVVRNGLHDLLLRALSKAHYDVARVVHHMYRYEYVCSSIRNRYWYEFRGNRWHPSDSGYGLRIRISTDVWREFAAAAASQQQMAIIATNDSQQQQHQELSKKLTDLSMKLKTTSYKENVMKECAELFYMEKFEDKLDSSTTLICFENGVYDLEKRDFREGRPDDFLSFSTGCDYVPYEPESPIMEEIRRFFCQVQPRHEMRDYLLSLFASFLGGDCRDQKFHIWTGSGCHAKGTPIMMHSGLIKAVEDVVVGDVLMGDDSTPRNVLELFRGTADMWRIVPAMGTPFTVNGDHVLSLVATKLDNITCNYDQTYCASWFEHCNLGITAKSKSFTTHDQAVTYLAEQAATNIVFVKDGDIVDIKVNDYMTIADCVGDSMYLYRPSFVDYKACSVQLDPYLIGTLLGAEDNDNKRIPVEYRCNSKDVRMQTLAGIIDAAGVYLSHTNQLALSHTDDVLLEDVISLARSLGLVCYKYSGRIVISGAGIGDIPVKLDSKRPYNEVAARNVRLVSFSVESVADSDFYGFELDGNHRYLMGDFVVTHNSNGKSACIDLFERSMGDYTCKFPVTLLTQKRAASNAATSELARAKGRRLAVLQEPSEDEKLHVGLMKELTGGDTIQCRALFRDPIEYRPQYKLVLLCNHLPNVPSDDGGTWRRIRVVEFTSKFCDKPQADNEFPIDLSLSQRFPLWRGHFLSMLLEEYWPLVAKGTISEPEDVLACTREYQSNNDYVSAFLDECVEKAADAYMIFTEAFSEFKTWVRDDSVPIRVPKKSEFKKALEKRMGRSVTISGCIGFKGVRLRNRFGGGPQQGDDIDN